MNCIMAVFKDILCAGLCTQHSFGIIMAALGKIYILQVRKMGQVTKVISFGPSVYR